MSACRSCGAQVRFVPTGRTNLATGKPVLQILDAEPTKGIVLGSLITTHERDDGLVIMFEPDPDDYMPTAARVVDVFTDHHATCPKADQWRR